MDVTADTGNALERMEKSLQEALREHCVGLDAAHDLSHARRVWQNARSIASKEATGDWPTLLAAAYMHDVVNIPKDSTSRPQASLLSSRFCRPILSRLRLSEERIVAVEHAIVAHSWSANVEAQSIEAKILQDADRLDALGALGVARAFYVGGLVKCGLYELSDPFAASRPLAGATFCIDHFADKLLRLPGRMHTTTAKHLAERRVSFMHAFLLQLSTELGVECAWLGSVYSPQPDLRGEACDS